MTRTGAALLDRTYPRLPNMTRLGSLPPSMRMSVPAHCSPLVHTAIPYALTSGTLESVSVRQEALILLSAPDS